MKKAPTKPAAPKKRGRGRPRKEDKARKEVSVFLPTDLLAELDRYVRELRKINPAASRGDVISARLRAFGPFRRRGTTK